MSINQSTHNEHESIMNILCNNILGGEISCPRGEVVVIQAIIAREFSPHAPRK